MQGKSKACAIEIKLIEPHAGGGREALRYAKHLPNTKNVGNGASKIYVCISLPSLNKMFENDLPKTQTIALGVIKWSFVASSLKAVPTQACSCWKSDAK